MVGNFPLARGLRTTAVGLAVGAALWASVRAVDAQSSHEWSATPDSPPPAARDAATSQFLARLPIGFRVTDSAVRPAAHVEPVAEAEASRERAEAPRESGLAKSEREPGTGGARPAGRGESSAESSAESSGNLAGGGLPLAPPGRRERSASAGTAPSAGRALATAVGSLAVVVGVLACLAWGARRFQPPRRGLPGELFLHLGTATLVGRQSVHVVRFGEKLLLVASTSAGLQTLSELTRPDEVQRLTQLCRSARAGGGPLASSLQRVLAEWTSEPGDGRVAGRGTTGGSFASSPRSGESTHA